MWDVNGGITMSYDCSYSTRKEMVPNVVVIVSSALNCEIELGSRSSALNMPDVLVDPILDGRFNVSTQNERLGVEI